MKKIFLIFFVLQACTTSNCSRKLKASDIAGLYYCDGCKIDMRNYKFNLRCVVSDFFCYDYFCSNKQIMNYSIYC